MANIGAALGQIGLDEIEMARGAVLEFERGAVTPGRGPKNFPIDGHLAHEVVGLIEVAREPSGGRHNGNLEFCFVAGWARVVGKPKGGGLKPGAGGGETEGKKGEKAPAKKEDCDSTFSNQ